MTFKHRTPILIAAACAVALAALPFLPRRSSAPVLPQPARLVLPEPAPAGPAAPLTAELLLDTASELDLIARAGHEALAAGTFEPRTTTELVSRVGDDPAELFRWVRDETWWVPYRGLLRGPSGLLRDRTGSSLDRALLLAELLQSAGHATRIVQADLGRAEAEALFERIGDVPPAERGEEELSGDLLAALARGLRVDPEGLRRTVADARRYGEDLRGKALKQTLAQLAVVTRGLADGRSRSFEPLEDDPIDVLSEHYWVQARIEGRWTDFDPAVPGAEIGEVLAKGRRLRPDALEERVHRIAVRVVAERWEGGELGEEVPLAFELHPSRGLSGYVRLSYEAVDAGRPDGRAADAASRASEAWRPHVEISGEHFVGPWVGADGRLHDDVSRVSNARDAHLTAVFLELEELGPAGGRAQRRTVFDWLGPARRERAPRTFEPTDDHRVERALALGGSYDLLPHASWTSVDAVVHDCLLALVEEASPLGQDLRALAEWDEEVQAAERIPSLLPLYTLSLMRQRWARHTNLTFVSGVHLLGMERRWVRDGDGHLRWQEVSEVLRAPIGVLPGADLDPVQERIERGLVDATTASILLDPAGEGPAALFGEARRGGAWVWIESTEDPAWDEVSISADLGRVVRGEQARGRLTLVPRGALVHEGRAVEGFWSVVPQTGELRWIDAVGRGGLPHRSPPANGDGERLGRRSIQDLLHSSLAMELCSQGTLGFLLDRAGDALKQ